MERVHAMVTTHLGEFNILLVFLATICPVSAEDGWERVPHWPI